MHPTSLLVIGTLLSATASAQEVPHPRDVLGFTPGDDYRIADFSQMQAYLGALSRSSPRVRLSSAGKSTEGRDILVAVISSEANLADLERYRDISRSLALARDLDDDAALDLARSGKTIVWIDAGLHAAETAHAQHALLLAHRVATEETAEMREIRDQVVLVLLPCLNPDGLDLVADWYRKTVHTPHQDSPMPWLFNTYSGYENNRDGYAQTQVETQILSRLLYDEWLPQVMYNHHQGFYPSRIFVPPFPDPFNPNIDPGVVRGIELVGASMQHRFEREGKNGVLSRFGFSSWYNGSVRTTTYFHNMVGILTETTHDSPSPFYYDPAEMPETFGNGWSTREPSTNYSRPWRGGTLRFRDAIDYMLTGSMGVLEAGAKYREELLYGMYQMGARQIELGRTVAPVAYVIPPDQHDAPTSAKFVEILMRGGIEVHRARAPFAAGGKPFDAGSYVTLLSQAFRPFAKDLLEPQRYPDIRRYPGGPPVPPYDNAGWTLSYQMGIETVPIDTPFNADLALLTEYPTVRGALIGNGAFGHVLDPRLNASFTAANRLLRDGHELLRATKPIRAGDVTFPAGAIIVRNDNSAPKLMQLTEHARALGIEARGIDREPDVPLSELTARRIGVYQSWVVEWVDNWTAAEGWTRYVLDRHEFNYDTLHNRDILAGDLISNFDVVVIPNQDVDDIVHGYREGRRQFGMVHQNLVPPEYQGGIGEQGVQALAEFAKAGGTLILVDRSTALAPRLQLPVRNVLENLPDTEFFGPGSVVGIVSNPAHPLGHGMPVRGAAYFRKSAAFTFDHPSVTGAVRYRETDVLMSGWMNGEHHVAGQWAVAEAATGRGRVVLLGFSPYFRGQPHGTFKLFFNALWR